MAHRKRNAHTYLIQHCTEHWSIRSTVSARMWQLDSRWVLTVFDTGESRLNLSTHYKSARTTTSNKPCKIVCVRRGSGRVGGFPASCSTVGDSSLMTSSSQTGTRHCTLWLTSESSDVTGQIHKNQRSNPGERARNVKPCEDFQTYYAELTVPDRSMAALFTCLL